MTRLLVFIFALFSFSLSQAQVLPKLIAVRLDPGYLYDLAEYNGLSMAQTATRVVTDIKTAGFNTIYVFAYSPVYGAFYPTQYNYTAVEGWYGQQNLLAALIAESRARGVKVIASLPVNNFKHVWQAQPGWRIKNKRGRDYKPFADTYLLSAYAPGFQKWYRGLVNDLLTRHPNLDGVEAVEGMIDYFWNKTSDHNTYANYDFQMKYPGIAVGGAQWRQHRADGLTLLHKILAQEAAIFQKPYHVVQTWTANSAGQLLSSQEIMDGSGFDFNAKMSVADNSARYVIGEFMWQQWKAEYGTSVFVPEWVTSATQQFVQKVAGRAHPVIHIEVSEFSGSSGYVNPTNNEFLRDLQAAFNTGYSVDVYDYYLLKSRGLLSGVGAILNAPTIINREIASK